MQGYSGFFSRSFSRHNDSNIILAYIFSDFNDLYFFRYRDFGFSFVYNDKTAPSENRRSG